MHSWVARQRCERKILVAAGAAADPGLNPGGAEYVLETAATSPNALPLQREPLRDKTSKVALPNSSLSNATAKQAQVPSQTR